MSDKTWNIMTRRGFYTKIGSDLIGVYASAEGPKLFINRDEYELMSSCWDVEMVAGRRQHIINFYWCGEVKLSLRCEAESNLFMSLYDYLGCRPLAARNA
ncbi:hypothetical protein PAESOLCIP111_02739 [Paenibacillus solanacearum]|uniref:Uncharacterized protein n=1 Tax=Paenibacillus solanacearum TaxID=2048548 RepID=A0A916K291_9BACL|nr:hypothetical protein [Paenibacillus solanacearum]CAG7625562.1 hypothetical protein PAESOLCIP111_02739 [Paenibacillus solanacearum]